MEPQDVEPIAAAEARRPRWWSPRRAWLPVAIAVLLAAGGAAWGWTIVEDRRVLERDTAKAEAGIAELKDELATDADELSEQEQVVATEREIAEDCLAAADAGVAYLHQVVRSLALLARFEESASQEAQDDVNRLIGEANRATRKCTEGLV